MRITPYDFTDFTLGVTEAGPPDAPAFLFLHGWPQSARAWAPVMETLAPKFRVLAPDLPGVGASRGAPSAEKAQLARVVNQLIERAALRDVIVVGHDVGGMVAFAHACTSPRGARGHVILNTVIPGIDPWTEVLRNPNIWHFAFHKIPRLPETLVSGHQRAYCDFFFDILTKRKAAITPEARAAYARDYERPEALKAGFDWYRAMDEDAALNAAAASSISTPILYLRGDGDPGSIEQYLDGFRLAGVRDIRGEVIANSGHFSAEESPGAVAAALERFQTEIGPR